MRLKNEKDLLPVLESLGLTRLEAQVYLTLLTRGEAEAKEIVQTFDIHFPQFYSLSSNLERKGFIEVQGGRPKRYRGVSLEEIARRKIKEMKKGVKILTQSIEEKRGNQGIASKPSVWLTRGIENILYNVNEMIKGAQFDVTIIIQDKFVPNIVKSLTGKRSEGVQIYFIVYPNPSEPDIIEQLNKIGRVRTCETCPFAILAIADCEKALMAHGLLEVAPPERQYGVVFDESLTPIFFSENFYQLWTRAKPLFPEEDLEDFPKTFRSQRMALAEIKNLLKKGKVVVNVKGRHARTGETFEEKGIVAGVTDDELHKSFILKLPDGRTFAIGGYSVLEEAKVELITILGVE